MTLTEKVARAICIADGCDPDKGSIGIGHTMPEGVPFKLWEARVKQAEAVIDMLLDDGYLGVVER